MTGRKGAPKKPPEKKQNDRVTFRLNSEQMARVQRAMGKNDTLSNFVRKTLLDKVDELLEE